MKVVFLCRTGCHAAPVAASVYLGLLPAAEHPASAAEIERVPYFGRLAGADRGFLLPCGRTAGGDEVFVAGRGRHGCLVGKVMAATAALCREEYRVIPCEHAVGEWRQLAMRLVQIIFPPRLGQAMAARLLRPCYHTLAGLAAEVRDGGRE